MDSLGEEVKVAPYKFSWVVTQEDLQTNLNWKMFMQHEESPEPHAHFGQSRNEDGTRVFRLDLDAGYFRPDATHWKRGSIRKEIHKLFKGVVHLPAGTTLVMIWTDDSSWLSLDYVRQNMESWDGRAEESRSLWERVRGTGRWAD
jgi:hypothetical protein